MAKQAMSKTELYAGWKGGRVVVADQPLSAGARWWVDDATGSNAAGWGMSPSRPFATIDYAIGNCTASKGDIIYVMPAHEETIASALGCVLDVEGVCVIGLGYGRQIPKLTLSALASTISITAASCMLKNINVFTSATDGVTTGITIGADADGFVLEDLVMTETAATEEFLIGISIAAACTDGRISGLKYYGTPGGTTSSAIVLVGAADRLIIENCYINVDASSSVILGTGAKSLGVWIHHNEVINVDDGAGLGIDLNDTTTGFMNDNRATGNLNTVEMFTGNLMCYCENYSSNAFNVQGILRPVVDS